MQRPIPYKFGLKFIRIELMLFVLVSYVKFDDDENFSCIWLSRNLVKATPYKNFPN